MPCKELDRAERVSDAFFAFDFDFGLTGVAGTRAGDLQYSALRLPPTRMFCKCAV